MTIMELKKAASNLGNVTTRAIDYRAKRIKNIYGPLTDDIAYGIVAQQAGVEVSKFIKDPQQLEEIRNQIDRISAIESGLPPKKPKAVIKTVLIPIARDLTLSDPILNSKVLNDAKDMAVHYSQLYIFENSVREVINRVLSKGLGSNWWNRTNIKKDVFENIQERIEKEKQNPWHGGRGAHPIYYTDISDLIYLFRRYWSYFNEFFPRLEWVTEKIEQISFSRNVVDHHNPLNKLDRKRLVMNLIDWQKQIEANKGKI